MTPRDEWAQDALMERDDEQAWLAQRNLDLGLGAGWVSRAEMIASLAAERAEVEAQSPTGEEWRRLNFAAVERDRLRWIAQLAVDREAHQEDAA